MASPLPNYWLPERKEITMERTIIRPARYDDVEAMFGLLQELFTLEKDFSPDPVKQRSGLKQLLTSPTAIIFAAEYDGEIVGMCTVQKVISTAEGGMSGLLEDFVVTPRCRDCGIGQSLIVFAEKWAINQGLVRLQLLAEGDNIAALRFYDRAGWQKTGLICRRKILRANSQI
jgi:ribosomal protein S18 acetylase RimI-like enzyme